jgi:hypothetical protein
VPEFLLRRHAATGQGLAGLLPWAGEQIGLPESRQCKIPVFRITDKPVALPQVVVYHKTYHEFSRFAG